MASSPAPYIQPEPSGITGRTGPSAAQQWADDYDKHAVATGVSDGSVKYDAPTRTEIEGDLAYVIVPTVYLYKEHGKAMAEEASATFVLHQEDGA